MKNHVASVLGVAPKDVRHKNRGELGEMFGAEMRAGRQSRILIEKGDTRLELFYNPKTTEDGGSGIAETEAPTGGAQKPDIVLQLIRQFNGKEGFRLSYLFDAKYRIDGQKGSVDTPPEDAINQMHRYRDAIYYRDGQKASAALKKEVIGGYISHPLRGAIFETMVMNECWKSGCNTGDVDGLFHYRDGKQQEIDLVSIRSGMTELIEVKSGQTPSSDWCNSLNKLSPVFGDAVTKSVVFGGDEDQRRGDVAYRSWRNLP